MAKHAGTTLFELLVLIAILGVLCALAIPSAAAVHRQRAGGSGARELTLVLREAQARAQAHDTLVVVQVAGNGDYLVTESDSPSGTDSAVRVRAGELGSGVSSTYPDGSVAFAARGWPTLVGSTVPRAGSFSLHGGRRVIVQLGGCIRCV